MELLLTLLRLKLKDEVVRNKAAYKIKKEEKRGYETSKRFRCINRRF